jgi:rhodanese-related sulfurtransferase
LSLALEEISIDTVSNIIDDKEKEIIVYCNNGTRSSEAKIKLEELGYANVYDLGAMTNWKE